MLRWAEEPTEGFDRLVVDLLNYALRDTFSEVIWEGDRDIFQCSRLFPDIETFRRECKKLIDGIGRRILYMPTEYHFYLLYRILEYYSLIYEEKYKDSGDECFRWFNWDDDEILRIRLDGVGRAYEDKVKKDEKYLRGICESPLRAFDYIVSTYFWDLGILYDARVYNQMGSYEKCKISSEGTFGVVNRLAPTDDELELEDFTEYNSEEYLRYGKLWSL